MFIGWCEEIKLQNKKKRANYNKLNKSRSGGAQLMYVKRIPLKLEGWGCASWGIEKQQSTPKKDELSEQGQKPIFLPVTFFYTSVLNCACKSFLSNKLEKKIKADLPACQGGPKKRWGVFEGYLKTPLTIFRPKINFWEKNFFDSETRDFSKSSNTPLKIDFSKNFFCIFFSIENTVF